MIFRKTHLKITAFIVSVILIFGATSLPVLAEGNNDHPLGYSLGASSLPVLEEGNNDHPLEYSLERLDESSVVALLNGWNGGGTGSLVASQSGDVVTVTGTVSDAAEKINMEIEDGITVLWQADLEFDSDFKPAGAHFIVLNGKGTFKMVSGSIKTGGPSSTLAAATFQCAKDVYVEIAGGELSTQAQQPRIISCYGELHITGGNLTAVAHESTYAGNGTVIRAGLNSSPAKVTISGGTLTGCGKSVISSEYDDVSLTITQGAKIINAAPYSESPDIGSTINFDKASVAVVIGDADTMLQGNPSTTVKGLSSVKTSGRGVVVLWDAEGTTFDSGSSDALQVTAGSTAVWSLQNGVPGILVTKGSDIYFVEISGVTVTGSNPVASITVNSSSNSITRKGGTMQMSANVLPANADNKDVTWSVSGSAATISKTGILTAKSNGTVTVRATATDGSGVYGEKTIAISGQYTGSSGGSSSGSGNSSGGTSVSDQQRMSNTAGFTGAAASSSNVNADGTVNAGTIKTELDKAIKESTGSTAVVRTRNANEIEVSALRTLASTAAAANKTATLHADTMSADGKAVQGRLYVEPAKLTALTTNLKLGVYTQHSDVSSAKALFEKYFSNKTVVVSLEQKGALGARLEIAAKVDLTGLNTSNLMFYNFDRASNQYIRIANPVYFIDSSGYLHFYTDMGGDIIISDQPLTQK